MRELDRSVTAFAAVAVTSVLSCAALGRQVRLRRRELDRERRNVAHLGALTRRQRVASQDTEAGRDAAVSFVQLMASLHYAKVDEYVIGVLAGATGEFREKFERSAPELRQLWIDHEALARCVVVDSAVESQIDGVLVIVLLFVDQTVVNTSIPDGELDRIRIRIAMEKEGERWLASMVELA